MQGKTRLALLASSKSLDSNLCLLMLLRGCVRISRQPASSQSKPFYIADTVDQHLYVAVTRARIQLFFIESDETAVASIVKLLTQDVPESLVNVTRLNDANVSSPVLENQHANSVQFTAKLEALRPGTSNDPRRWSLRAEQLMQQRSYKDVGQS